MRRTPTCVVPERAARGRPPHMAHRHGASHSRVPSGVPRHGTQADRAHTLRQGHTSSGLSPQTYRCPTKAGELEKCRRDTSGWSGQVISWSVCTSKAQRLVVSPMCNLNVVYSSVYLTKRRTSFPDQSGVDSSPTPPRVPQPLGRTVTDKTAPFVQSVVLRTLASHIDSPYRVHWSTPNGR